MHPVITIMQSLAKGCNLDWYSALMMAPSVLPAQDDLGQGLYGEEVVNAQKILQHCCVARLT